MGDALTTRVECHSGFTYAEKPLAFYWEGRRLNVTAIEDHWRTPAGPCFRVRSEDDLCFELSYREAEDLWLIRPA